MKNYEIQMILMKALSPQEIYVTGDSNHFQVIVVDKIFNGMSRVKQQQTIYKPLIKYIVENRIHALSVKVYTPQEWERDRKLNNL